MALSLVIGTTASGRTVFAALDDGKQAEIRVDELPARVIRVENAGGDRVFVTDRGALLVPREGPARLDGMVVGDA